MRLVDSTLREGEQSFGVYFPARARRDVLTRLARLGVDEVELPSPLRDPSVPPLAAHALALEDGPAVSVWCACRADALAAGAALGAHWVHLGMPASRFHLAGRLDMTLEQGEAHLARHVELALQAGARAVSVGLEDASRAAPEDLERLGRAALRAGAGRVRLSDTVGLWQPLGVARLVERLKAALDAPLGVHCHNDFGMATANALSGLLAGADFADASVLGLGERAGLARLEELAAYTALNLGAPYRVEELAGLCQAVSEASGVPIEARKPVAGAGQFACETGLHVHGLARDPALFEPYDPARLGLSRRVALGGKSGRAAVAARLRELGQDPASRDLDALTEAVREASRRLGRPLTDEEARAILAP
ncbi:2-isopropylmalate synthase [Fundidesulfovibrio magnetotacticus]|uniref:2-isopropylmalate synthase n=1 Tax=Fundidesulfovibrio magnetotacticus TaxID=2730080 RepID=A0A6V8LMW2_9BACT|nr:hypothetical protein [Fundidesulfovibrio magnetotacticus]GFK93014.1 2-isopropylmalate synthase [Fundidesulfovibrio magnetotacticus]